jgi:predicted 3-demethylubiquinone-9 3-methyltransferase (glyoxalase superfamily)
MPNTPIHPFLWFDHDAEAAAEFYVEVFPDSRITGISRLPDGSAQIVSFELRGQRFSAINGGPAHAGFTEAISFMIDCADQAEVDHYWGHLTAGGEESRCGWCKDRFGLSWQVVPRRLPELLGAADREAAGRALEAMLGMQKIVVAELETAAAGAGAAS